MTDARLPGQVPPSPPLPGDAGADVAPRLPARSARWAVLDGAREDLRGCLLTVLVLALTGLAAGAVWHWLAPRADFRVTDTGVVPVGGAPSAELFMSDDGVYLVVLAVLGLLAGVGVWLLRRRRGVVALTALAAGVLAASVVAWQFGELLGAGPTDEQLADVGATVTTGLHLGATAAVAVGPFVAVLTYLVAAALTAQDDLGRTPAAAAPATSPLPEAQPAT